MAATTLEFLALQQAKILAELGDMRAEMRTLRNDMDMLIRIVTRLDHTVDAVREDIRMLWLNRAICAGLEALESK
jgi:hypothetical protein